MGLFDGSREKRVKKRHIPGEEDFPARRSYVKADGSQPMQIRRPRSFADVEEIIDRLKDKLTVIVYLSELNSATAERVTDILSGAIYALDGGMAKLEKDMFIFTPDGVDEK